LHEVCLTLPEFKGLQHEAHHSIFNHSNFNGFPHL
jgi:hypothetical protein